MGGDPIRFGTDGWRAIMCDAFTFENVRRVVRGIVRTVQESGEAEKGLVIGRDARFMGEQFVREAAAVCVEEGVPVWVIEDDAPTPLVAFSAVHQQAAGAIMFTASHNPPEYHGIKFIPGYGGPATLEITRAIEGHVAQLTGEKAADPPPSALRTVVPDEAYYEQLLSLVDVDAIRKARLRVAYDSMHGSGRRYTPEVLRRVGVAVDSLRNWRDPLFGGVTPEPTAAHLKGLAEHVLAHRMDLGLATDGDADRFGVIDSDGRYVSANEVLVLIAYHLLTHRGARGALVRTVATTHQLDRLAEAYGLSCIETPVGFKHISEEMRRSEVLLGGEESGGMSIGGHIPEKDGILALLLMAELRAFADRPLSEVRDEIFAKIGGSQNRRIDMRVTDAAKRSILEELSASPPDRVAGWEVRSVSTLDGVKLVLEGDRWLLLRASGTEPLLRLYVEAPTEKEMLALVEWANERIETATHV